MRIISCLLLATSLVVLSGCGSSNVSVPASVPDAVVEPAATDVENVAAEVEPDQAQVEFDAIKSEYDAEYSAFTDAYRGATDNAARQAARKLSPDAAKYGTRFMGFAKSHPDSEAAVDALVWITGNVRGAESAAAKQKLFESHSSNAKLAPVIMMMSYDRSEEAIGQLRGLLDNENDSILAVTKYALGSLLISEDSNSAEAQEMLQSVVDDHADVTISYGTRSLKIAPRAKGQLIEATQLQVGLVAPDIEAEDLDGVNFKLSDYRGKVVVLDFWGHW